jgi:hypothetical protein
MFMAAFLALDAFGHLAAMNGNVRWRVDANTHRATGNV